jgi:hypothetical protein
LLITISAVGRWLADRVLRVVFGVDLADYVDEFVGKIPRNFEKTGVKGYAVPSLDQRAAMQAAFAQIMAGNLSGARTTLKAKGIKYRVDSVYERRLGQWLTILHEPAPPTGSSWSHAWGMYVYAPVSTTGAVIEIPHPVFDEKTEILGVEAFLHGQATVLLVAGAERYANGPKLPKPGDNEADVAHRMDSVFEGIHEQALSALASPRAAQFHGFEADGAASAVQLVVSAGMDSSTATPPTPAQTVTDALTKAGFDACLYASPLCPATGGLGGTLNVQGTWANALGLTFLHLEIVQAIRVPVDAAGVARRTLLADTVIDSLM